MEENGVVEYKKKKFLYSEEGEVVRLTPREADCLHYLSKGCSYKAIAKKMAISPRTVEDHLNHIKQKAHYHTSIELISNLKSIN
ncbi:MAG TPA: helix-turn-helix transcriptional regulator [Coxiellaceae bacterium]|nr:helix-turn-helix transcriptional regulator [Coxiellaceae bacterium]